MSLSSRIGESGKINVSASFLQPRVFLRKAPLHALLLKIVNLDDMECGDAPKMHARAPQFFTYFLRGSINRNPQMPPLRQQDTTDF